MKGRAEFNAPARSRDEALHPVEQSLYPGPSMSRVRILDLFREVPIEPQCAALAEHLEGIHFGAAFGEYRLDNQSALQMELYGRAVVFASNGTHRSVDPGDLTLENKANQIGMVTSQIEQRPAAAGA